MNNCYKINYHGPVLIDELDLNLVTPEYQSTWMIDCLKSDGVLHPEFIKFIRETLGFFESSWEKGGESIGILKGEPGENFGIHIDRGCEWTVNYICGSDESEMKWYKFKDGVSLDDGYEVPIPNKNKTYMAYHSHQVEYINSAHNLSGLYLMRIGIPHSVHNYSKSKRRWCLSTKNTRDRTPWEDMVEYFKQRVELVNV
jgi:hypothetical protein